MAKTKIEIERIMKKVILHVGLHKTGSSAIQASLVNGLLHGSGYTYHGFGEQNGSVGLFTLFADEPHRHPQHLRMGMSPKDVADYRTKIVREFEQLLSTTQEHIVLSGEDCSILSAHEIAKIPGFFQAFGFEVRVVIYVRPWHNLLSSVWCELLKHSHLYIDLDFNPTLWNTHLDLKSKITKFDDVFGKSQVSVSSYNKHNFPEGCVVTDFCRKLNITVDRTRIVNANMGFSLPTTQLFYIYRKYGPPRGHSALDFKRNQTLIYQLEFIKGPAVYFHSNLTQKILAPFRLQKAWMEERIGGAFHEVFHDDNPHVIKSESDLLNLSDNAMNWLCVQCGLDKLKLSSNAYSYTDIAHHLFLFESKQFRVKKKSLTKRLRKKMSHIFNAFLKKVESSASW